MNRVLVVAAHPDDEILGVGATIRKYVEKGEETYALILGEGQTSRWKTRADADRDVVEALHQDSSAAAGVIGFREVAFESLPDNRFDSVALLDVVKLVEKYIEKWNPNIIYTHHSGDLNIDHRITNEAVLTATRPIGDYTVCEVYGFETVSSTEWNFGRKTDAFFPQKYVDVTGTLEIKCEAMKKYESELCEFPHPRSQDMLRALAEVRGATVGVRYAEAFEVLRIVDIG